MSETLTDAEAAEAKAVLRGIFPSLDGDNYGLEPTQTELDVYRAGKAAGRAEAAADTRDAERYRWIKKTRGWDSWLGDPPSPANDAWNGIELGKGTDEQLDESIDAALAAK